MAELILQLKGVELWRVPITKTQTTIGRDAESDMVVDNQATSRVHATVGVVEGLFIVVDCGSRNGTMLNGERVERRALNDGDQITIGKHTVVFKEAGGTPLAQLLPREEAEAASRESRNIVETAVIHRDDVLNPEQMAAARVRVGTPAPDGATRPLSVPPPGNAVVHPVVRPRTTTSPPGRVTVDQAPRGDSDLVAVLGLALVISLGVIVYLAMR